MTSRRLTARELRRAVDRHRALLAAGLTAAAVAAGLSALSPSPAPVAGVLVAARDLPSGARLDGADLRRSDVPRQLVPAGALTDPTEAAGRVLSGAVRAGEPLTDARLLGRAVPAGQVAVPVRLAEPALPLLVEPGDAVDVLATPQSGAAAAETVAAGVRVLAVPVTDAQAGEGSLLVLATSPPVAARLAAAAVTSRLSVSVLPS